MMICNNCGWNNTDASPFCSGCGKPLGREAIYNVSANQNINASNNNQFGQGTTYNQYNQSTTNAQYNQSTTGNQYTNTAYTNSQYNQNVSGNQYTNTSYANNQYNQSTTGNQYTNTSYTNNQYNQAVSGAQNVNTSNLNAQYGGMQNSAYNYANNPSTTNVASGASTYYGQGAQKAPVKSKKGKSILMIAIAFIVAFAIIGVIVAMGSNKPSKGGVHRAGGSASVKDPTRTIMVYIVGADLESRGGFATRQISEMVKAESSDKLNIVLEAGGTTEWHNDTFEGNKVQRAVVKDGDVKVVDTLGRKNMADRKTLTEFIMWTAQNYPADEYDIIFYNHGGSASGGYGIDISHNCDSMMLDEMEEALADAGIKFGFIGFDACLMADFETAYIFRKHADYLVASESVEYTLSGWNYTAFLDAIAEDCNISTKEICELIVSSTSKEYESFIKGNNEYGMKIDFWTYSISAIDLGQMDNMYKDMCSFMGELKGLIEKGNKTPYLGNVVYHTKYFGGKETDLFDVNSFLSQMKTIGCKKPKAVLEDLDKAIIANKTNIPDCCGMGMYIPYYALDNCKKTMNSIGKYMNDTNYVTAMYEWASILAYNLEGKMPDWYRADIAEKCMESVHDFEEGGKSPFKYDDSLGGYVWKLKGNEAYELATVYEQVYIYFNNAFYSLGERDVTAYAGNEIKAVFDGTWYAINGIFVPIFTQGRENTIDGLDYTYSHIPASLNRNGSSTPVNLIVVFENGKTEGTVKGFILRDETYNTMNLICYDLEIGDTVSLCYQRVNDNMKIVKEDTMDPLFTYNGSEISVGRYNLPSDMIYYYKCTVSDYFRKVYESKFITNNY